MIDHSKIRIDDLLINRMVILQDPQGFCFGIDAVLLAHFPQLCNGQSWVDLGCGCGAIALLLTSRAPIVVTGIEIQKDSAALARASVARNSLQKQIRIVQADLRCLDHVLPAAAYDGIVCNPPYYPLNSGKISVNAAKAVARHELCCTVKDILTAADYLLNGTGVLCLIHLARRYEEIRALLPQVHFYEQVRRFIRSRPGQTPEFVLLQVGRQSLDFRQLPDLCIYDDQGQYDPEISAYYGL